MISPFKIVLLTAMVSAIAGGVVSIIGVIRWDTNNKTIVTRVRPPPHVTVPNTSEPDNNLP